MHSVRPGPVVLGGTSYRCLYGEATTIFLAHTQIDKIPCDDQIPISQSCRQPPAETRGRLFMRTRRANLRVYTLVFLCIKMPNGQHVTLTY